MIYNEKNLARELGISRTPVREALLELSSKKLVKFLPQKGLIINTFSRKDIDNVFEIRTALETFSIKKICLSKTNLDISNLQQTLDEQNNAVSNKDILRFMEEDRQFHIGFTKLASNDYLMDMMNDIRDIMHLMGLRALNIKGRMEQVVKEHENILKAVAQGDTAKAVERMEYHLDYSKTAVNATQKEETRHGQT